MTFMSAEALRVSELEHLALQAALRRMESGEAKVRMDYFEDTCGTARCIAGWAHHEDRRAFPEISTSRAVALMMARLPASLCEVFGLVGSPRALDVNDAQQAAHVLRAWLETGCCIWDEVLG